MSSAGKGDKPRPCDFAKFQSEHERIFAKRTDEPHEIGDVVDGAECLGRGSFRLIDHREQSLRDTFE